MRRRDLIDFKVSDVWRDHYAAQGMTYDSGRRPRSQPASQASGAPPSSESGMSALLTLIREQELKIHALTAELLQVKQAKKKPEPPKSDEGVE